MSSNRGFSSFNLDRTPASERSAVWKDFLNDFFYDYEIKLPNDFYDGRFQGAHLNGFKVASIASDPMSVFRTPQQVQKDGLDAYFLLLPTQDEIALSQRHNVAAVKGKSFTLVSTSEPYDYHQKSTTSFNNLIIPGPVLRSVVPIADDFLGHTISTGPVSELFFDQATSLCTNINVLDEKILSVLERHTLELLGLVFDGADLACRSSAMSESHYSRIMAFINRNFQKSDLGIDQISSALKISPRYIQHIVSRHRTTITKAVNDRRLAATKAMLSSATCKHQSISTIAYRAGFRDIPHFNRLFKISTGCSPSQYRRSHGKVVG